MFVLSLSGASGISSSGPAFFPMTTVTNLTFPSSKSPTIFSMLLPVLTDFRSIITMITFMESGRAPPLGWKNRYFASLRAFTKSGEPLGNLAPCIRVNKDSLSVFWNGKTMLDL